MTWVQSDDHLMSLGDNWDSYGASPVDPACLLAAKRLAACVPVPLSYRWATGSGGIEQGWCPADPMDPDSARVVVVTDPDGWWMTVDEVDEDWISFDPALFVDRVSRKAA